jgi:hypothetical protein
MVFGFVLSALLATSIALFQRRREGQRATEAPIKPAVLGIGGVDAALVLPIHDAIPEGDGDTGVESPAPRSG